jgi:hypothetical protein
VNINPYSHPLLYQPCPHCNGTGNASGEYTPDDCHQPAACPHCNNGQVRRPEVEMTLASIENELAALCAEFQTTEAPALRDALSERMALLNAILEMETGD